MKILGKNPLIGTVSISGAKNAALPIIVASILTDDSIHLSNLPHISDVFALISMLEQMNAKVNICNSKYVGTIRCSNLQHTPLFNSDKLRGSIWLIAALLAKYKKAEIAIPGGCNLNKGERKIEMHLSVLAAMGAKIHINTRTIKAIAPRNGLIGTYFKFRIPSVGATISAILAATLAQGTTHLVNCAIEPEILDMCNMLKKMGAKITMTNEREFIIEGVKSLHGTSHRVMADRIEACTYAIAAAITNGNIVLKNIEYDVIKNVFNKMEEAGVQVINSDEGISISRATQQFNSIHIKTDPYPGFPTDAQPLLAILMCVATGKSTIVENIYDNRFLYTHELQKMGAKISVDSSNTFCTIQGTKSLKGANVKAYDLRSGAAMILAGLMAEGETIINDSFLVNRGYYNIVEKLRKCGAQVHYTNQDTATNVTQEIKRDVKNEKLAFST
ncbi:UDP-N-acetylglucosamine 1-carboxyvinyltransferase [Candidatus Sneabacter namystus]|uniref:UDP-N-acetylglucosamine 1-carboxyvinyltransferase n=1 Tax=Candidatus Sneabacter namystus TaxID=2601646 RepID=A0A5C0UIW1_9RICK|nr:UDP-N-acetylglucosamine 1-carboxyvinyltransferase [Candidatus Sneabacter namystus]QEK39551.1 UDP-N-acetylglucosamine 1-carboxyvinyltransferase [Candidatus Sneabacter namystus]